MERIASFTVDHTVLTPASTSPGGTATPSPWISASKSPTPAIF